MIISDFEGLGPSLRPAARKGLWSCVVMFRSSLFTRPCASYTS